ncbi:50S ribosomal protein L17 [Enterobacteriaceae endosymbiont of Neohaemonia nigricornis]|uniref:50S ribosomal protein L17 n=1 Tax=Enterobacteriaceae endosymbiont of Neohaemonia nigricornis TaxID=2675792 RepID=UPI0014496C54|nr:50S ribosomal protein L17 [Enterobacteriaceae endosymbiont of Neohaemonia nigricornis]QJC30444.1 50S ribosomal protein L17 [Enterobacteriaceae endosymbiont of Neohaemonia nigricornis]
MRHCKTGRYFNMNHSHRHSMLYNLINSLIDKEIIKITLARAKELRRIIEPLITKAKINSIANKRFIRSKINNKKNVIKLFNVLAPKFKNRPGGYTRIVKCGFRNGDKAPIAYIELLERINK